MDPVTKPPSKSGVKVVLIVLCALLVLGAAVVAVVVGTVTSSVSTGMDKARVDTTNIAMLGTTMGLKLYFARFDKFPTDREGLQAVVNAKFLDELPKDAWGRTIAYRADGNGFVLTSLGSDGAPGGEGSAADIEQRYTPKAN